MEIKRSVLVPYSVEDMFDLIEQAENYPLFLPWCVSSRILERSDEWVGARIDFKYLQIRFGFSTRNPKRRPESLKVRMTEGPFRHFHADWLLTPLGEGGLHGCRINFDLSYEVSDGLLDRVAARAVEMVARSMMDAFVKRAEETLQPASAGLARQPVPVPPAGAAAPDAAAAAQPAAAPDVQSEPVFDTLAPAETGPRGEPSHVLAAAEAAVGQATEPAAAAQQFAASDDREAAQPSTPAQAVAEEDLKSAAAVAAAGAGAAVTVVWPLAPIAAAPITTGTTGTEKPMSPVPTDVVEAVRQCALSAELSADQSAVLAGLMQMKTFGAREVVAPEDLSDNRLCIIVQGELAAIKAFGTDAEELLVSLKAGDFAHELGFLDGAKRYASLVAVTPATVLLLEREALESLIHTHPVILYRVMCAIVRTVHRIQTRLAVQASELTNYIVKQHGRY